MTGNPNHALSPTGMKDVDWKKQSRVKWQIWNMHGPTVYKGTDMAIGVNEYARLNRTNAGPYRLRAWIDDEYVDLRPLIWPEEN